MVGKLCLAIIAFVGGPFALVELYSYLRPNVEIAAPQNFFEPTDPFSGFFEIRNDGSSSIHLVRARCIFRETDYDAKRKMVVTNNIGTIDFGDRVLDSEQPQTFQCAFKFHLGSVTGASLTVDLFFKPSILRWEHNTRRDFLAVRNQEGKWFWLAQ